MGKIKGMKPFTGEKYGLLFIQGNAITEDEYLAHRLGNKKGFVSETITRPQALKLGLVAAEEEPKE